MYPGVGLYPKGSNVLIEGGLEGVKRNEAPGSKAPAGMQTHMVVFSVEYI